MNGWVGPSRPPIAFIPPVLTLRTPVRPRPHPTMPDLRLFARRHHLAKPSAMQLKGWETDTPPLGEARDNKKRGGRMLAASGASPAEALIPELPEGAPARGVYVRVPFATEPTPLREFLWGLMAGTAELGAALQAPFALTRRTLADKMPFWADAMADPARWVALPAEQARVVTVRRAAAADARAAADAAAAQAKKKGRGRRGAVAAPVLPPPPLPRRSRLNAGFPSPGVGVVVLTNVAVVWGVLHANPPF